MIFADENFSRRIDISLIFFFFSFSFSSCTFLPAGEVRVKRVTFRCACCRRILQENPRIKNQRYCGAAECQRSRTTTGVTGNYSKKEITHPLPLQYHSPATEEKRPGKKVSSAAASRELQRVFIVPLPIFYAAKCLVCYPEISYCLEVRYCTCPPLRGEAVTGEEFVKSIDPAPLRSHFSATLSEHAPTRALVHKSTTHTQGLYQRKRSPNKPAWPDGSPARHNNR